MRRVVITGLGLVSPLGVGVAPAWSNLIAGKSGIARIEHFEVGDMPCRIAGLVPRGPGGFEPERVVAKRELRHMDEFIVFALEAANQALADAGLEKDSDEARERSGVLVGSGIGGVRMIAENAVVLHERGPRRVSPYFIPGCLINEASGAISLRHGLRGPVHAVVTACATGAHAIGDAGRLVAFGDADVMVAGGVEAATCRLTLAGFASMRALSTAWNDEPERASRPWDRDRDGFVLGEGAGILVLEERERALRRGATIYGELLGYGLSGDAYHISAPEPHGDGARRAMQAALSRAQLAPSDIDYINAHATSTGIGDPVEIAAVKTLFGADAQRVAMSSTKSATGHLLGAAGAVEAIFSILALREGVAPATLNLEHIDEGCTGIDLVPREAKQLRMRHVLSNSFGFGGTNAALVFGPG